MRDSIKQWVDKIEVNRPYCDNHNNALLEIDIKSGDRYCGQCIKGTNSEPQDLYTFSKNQVRDWLQLLEDGRAAHERFFHVTRDIDEY